MKKLFSFITLISLVASLCAQTAPQRLMREATKEALSFMFDTPGSLPASGWSENYEQHIYTQNDIQITFESASRQNSTIHDVPVTRGKYVLLKLLAPEQHILSVTLTTRQWGTKAQTITLYAGADELSLDDTGITSSDFELSASDFESDITTLKFQFQTSNEIGIESITVYYGTGSAPTVKAPQFSVPQGNYIDPISVNVTSTTPGATIRYTLDGTRPDATSPRLAAALNIFSTTTVNAIAILGNDTSAMSSVTYFFPTEVSSIAQFIANADSVQNAKITENVVVVRQETFNGKVHTFIQDPSGAIEIVGLDPDGVLSSPDIVPGAVLGQLVGRLVVEHAKVNQLIPAKLVARNTTDAVRKQTVVLDSVRLPEYSNRYVAIDRLIVQRSTSFTPGYSDEITLSRNGYQIVGVSQFNLISGAFMAGDSVNVEGLLYNDGMRNLLLLTSIKTTPRTLFLPTFSVEGGNYINPLQVELATTTPDAHVIYTLNGATPGKSAFVYDSPITINSTTTIKAATVFEADTSAVVEQTYQFPTTYTDINSLTRFANNDNFIRLAGAVTSSFVGSLDDTMHVFLADASGAIVMKVADDDETIDGRQIEEAQQFTNIYATYVVEDRLRTIRPIVLPEHETVDPVSPREIKIENIKLDDQSAFVVIRNITLADSIDFSDADSDNSIVLTQGGASITATTTFGGVEAKIEQKAVADFYGLVTLNGATPELTITTIVKTKDAPVDVELAATQVLIYANNGTLYVETETDTDVAVYDMLGRALYSGRTAASVCQINSLSHGVYVVKVGNATYKVIL